MAIIKGRAPAANVGGQILRLIHGLLGRVNVPRTLGYRAVPDLLWGMRRRLFPRPTLEIREPVDDPTTADSDRRRSGAVLAEPLECSSTDAQEFGSLRIR